MDGIGPERRDGKYADRVEACTTASKFHTLVVVCIVFISICVTHTHMRDVRTYREAVHMHVDLGSRPYRAPAPEPTISNYAALTGIYLYQCRI